jgi:enoyl-CoA hydratase
VSLVAVEEHDGIAVLTLDRPPANAFAPELVGRLRAALRENAGVRALVLTSAHPGLFSAGWDLPRISAMDRAEMKEYLESFCDLVFEIFVCPAPVVAALPGHAIAGGLIVACAADERYAAEGAARFGLSEVALGVPLPACCLELFAYVLGPRPMERLTASAQNLPADQALSLGLLDRVVPASSLLDASLERASQLARGSAAAYAEVKRRARAETVARFNAARKDDRFLDFWFSPEARKRIAALVEKLTGKTNSSTGSSLRPPSLSS